MSKPFAFKQLVVEYILDRYSMLVYAKNRVVMEAFFSSENYIHVRVLVVPNNLRRKGLGSVTLNYVKKLARTFRTNIVLMPHAIDDVPVEKVIAFYERNGFTKFNDDGYYVWNSMK